MDVCAVGPFLERGPNGGWGSQSLGTKERGAVWPRQTAVCPQLLKFCTGVSKKDRHREKVRAAWTGWLRR